MPGSRTTAVFSLALTLAAVLFAACAGTAPPALRVPAPLPAGVGQLRVLAPPPSAGDGPFPVLYFLHDLWGSDAVLWKHGIAPRLASAMARGEVPPFLLVAPDGDRAFWADSSDGRRRYQQWVTAELPREVAARWPVRQGPGSRAYVGISMGGLGAVRMGLLHPEETAAIAAVSGLLVPLDRAFVDDANPLLRHFLVRVFGRGPDDAALRASDVYRLLGSREWVPRSGAADAALPDLLLLAGTEDKYRLDEASALFAGHARTKGLAVDLRLSSGGHDWRYWRGAAETALRWAAQELAAAGPPP